MKKRMGALIFTLVLALSLAAPAFAADGDFTIENGVLTKYNGPGGDVTIPDGVASIGREAFSNCEDLTSVTIPNSVTSIGDAVFWGCEGLTSVAIPSSVTSIGEGAFYWCTGLTSITIPNSVTSIGDAAFWGCTGLTSAAIPSGVTSIGKYVFYNCTGLTSVTIPSSITSIGNQAFFFCSGLTSVTIPSSVTSIGTAAFSGCISLTSVTIPSSVTSIGNGAFAGCTSLTSVSIPSSVTSINQAAFIRCDSITDVYYSGSEVQWNALYIGDDNDNLTSAAIHYLCTLPTAPTAYPSTQSVLVDGRTVEFPCYALKDENGNDTNYVKLRDVAQILSGTPAQFEVSWDGAVNIVTGQSYTANGTEMSTPFSGDRTYTVPTSETRVNGAAADLDAIVLTDDAGNGYTYYKLRDLGAALGFSVDWSADKGIFIETDKPQT